MICFGLTRMYLLAPGCKFLIIPKSPILLTWYTNKKSIIFSQVFRNIYKMAKPNGQIFLTIMEYSCADASFHELNQHPKWGKYGQKMTVSPFYYSSSPEDAYRKLLGDAGFVNYTLKTEKVSYDWDNEETWKSK